MELTDTIKYHLKEFSTAKDSSNPKHIMPEFLAQDNYVLDIGWGIGQTFAASLCLKRMVLVGIDIDYEALSYDKNRFDNIFYLSSTANSLCLKDNTFDLIISRVSLPYTNIPKAIKEISRVLKNGGRIWITLHPPTMTIKHLLKSLKRFLYKDVIHRHYVIINGLIFHFFGLQFAFPINGKYESFQTKKGMVRILKRSGFDNIKIFKKNHFLITANFTG